MFYKLRTPKTVDSTQGENIYHLWIYSIEQDIAFGIDMDMVLLFTYMVGLRKLTRNIKVMGANWPPTICGKEQIFFSVFLKLEKKRILESLAFLGSAASLRRLIRYPPKKWSG